MPFGNHGKSGYSDDLERAPLSAADDDGDKLPSLPPYSDNPNRLNGRGSASTNGENANDPSISIVRGSAVGDAEEESSHFLRQGAYSTPSKSKARRATRYRGNLVCAYIRKWLTCQCIQCCSDDTRYSRVISNSNERKESPCRRSAMMLFYIFLLVVIMACATLIGYIVAQDGNPFSGAASNDRLVGPLPPPPANLHDACNDWITVEGRTGCQKLCDVAKCCSLPESDSGSCGKSQATYCATYRAACMALELSTPEGDASGSSGGGGSGLKSGELLESNTKLTAPKPSYLDDICDIESLKTPNGFDQCSSVCRPSRCCHPEYNCEVTNERFCSTYETPCANVAETWRGSGHATGNSDTDNNSISSLVMRKCNSASINPPDECIEACYPGACCYVSDGYPPIERLFEDHYGAAMSPMKSIDSCSSKVGFCQQFGSCEHLNHLKDSSGWHNDEVTYELDISSVCMPEYISKHGALECSNVCQPAHCCFSGEFTCDDANVGNINCKDYSQCGLLYPRATDEKSTQKLFLLAKQIDEKCSEVSLSSASGRSECQNMCKDKLCCFEDGDYGCADDPSQSCLAYAGCDTLVDTPLSFVNKLIEPPPKQESKPGDSEQAISVDEFVDQLDKTCSEEALETLEGIQKCHNKCQTHLCCFTSDSALVGNDCSKVHPVACDAYKPCQRLVKPTTKPKDDVTDHNSSEKSVASICERPGNEQPEVVDEWIKDCHAICAPRLCCFSDPSLDSNCRDTVGDEECDDYSPCQVLLGVGDSAPQSSMGQLEDVPRTIEAVCNEKTANDSDLYDQCEDKCSERSCCFEDEPSISCYNMEKDWCDEFSACDYVDYEFTIFAAASLVVSGTSTPPPTPQNMYDIVCSREKFDDNRDICRDLCDEYECCFNSGDSCYESNRQDCDHHYDCEVFFGEEVAATSSTVISSKQSSISAGGASKSAELDALQAEIEDACSEESLITIEGISNCWNHCRSHLCCFPADESLAKGDCSEKYENECNAHSVCESLVSTYTKWNPPSTLSDRNAVKKAVDEKCRLTSEEPSPEWVSGCHQVCQDRVCCLADPDTQSNCYDLIGKSTCEDYEACEILVSVHGDEDQGEVIDQVCNSQVQTDKNLFSKCFEACKTRACCFEEEGPYSCFGMETDWCTEYAACNQVGFYLPSNMEESEEPPPEVDFSAIDEKCERHYLLSFGSEECEFLCDPFGCCFDDNDGCIDVSVKGMCPQAHKRCKNIFAPDSEDLKILLTCKEEALEKSVDPCSDKCDPMECCFADDGNHDGSDPCPSNVADKCEDYTACSLYFESYKEYDVDDQLNESSAASASAPSKASFKDLCSPSTIGLNWRKCQEQCQSFECCFSLENNCYEAQSLECQEYDICSEFYDKTAPETSLPGGSLISMKTKCSLANMDENLDECGSWCTPYECCFYYSNSCYDSNADECNEHEICSTVFDRLRKKSAMQPSGNVPSSQLSDNELMILARACNGQKVESDDSECRMLCKGAECCFASEKCNEMDAFCKDHDVCQRVFN